MELEKILVLIAKIGAAVGSIALIITYSRNFIKLIKDCLSVPDAVKKIEYELKYNGGSSLKDAVGRIEARQLMQEQRLCFILDSNPDIITFETDEKGNCTRVSPGYLNLCGKTRDECIGSEWVNSIHPDDREIVFKNWKDSIDYSRHFNMNYRFINGEKITEVTCKATPVISKDTIISWIGVLKVKD